MTSLTLVRRIKARQSIVFDALTTAEGVASWWGPDGGPVLVGRLTPRLVAASGYASACSMEASMRVAANISRS